jgi:hypothetical protein
MINGRAVPALERLFFSVSRGKSAGQADQHSTLPQPWFCSRPVALLVLAALAVKGGPAKPDLARGLLDVIAEHFPDRDVDAVGDSA